ncbi:SH3 domain-containing protein [Gemmata sp. JC673]|uniref:SH3 domain-containing protein n=1 Tax=Gemmata algarum TaxID=2975278 RepID=A0ABU5EYE1_9BACT|nr:SH3 domain-containing protein [Gemmata algarum]MDY3559943.1 SH3 domain-containing protein [Gemmata algarum]
MLRTPLVGLLALSFAVTASAESQPYKAVVIDEEVKLRAGPSDNFPDTGTLPKGATVLVEKDEGNGWLAVATYGTSVSWVQTQFIRDPLRESAEHAGEPARELPVPRHVIVDHDEEDEVTLAAGKVGLNHPLNSRRIKIPRGTPLTLIGPKGNFAVKDGEAPKTWYMIVSPAGDFRYLPKTAVQLEKSASSSYTVRVNETVAPLPPGADAGAKPLSATPAGGAVASVPGPAVTPAAAGGATPSKPIVNHPLWAQAEAAERENRLSDAEKLYYQYAAEIRRTNGDYDIATLCFTRIHAIREKQRGTTRTATATPVPNAVRPAGRDELVARPSSSGERRVTVGVPEPLPPAADPEERGGWHAGTLRRSNMTPDGPNRQLYMLETPQGVVELYVAAGAGVDLNRYLGRRVNVYGTPTSRTGLQKPYLVATEAEPMR